MEHEDPVIRGMAISPASIEKDLDGLRYWARQLGSPLEFRQYCDKDGFDRADDRIIRKALRVTRTHPTFIYLGGHTELLGGELAYAPANYVDSPERKLVTYESMRQLVLRHPDAASLLLVTEVCECDNFLGLPYMLDYEGDEPRWVRTQYYDSFIGGSSSIVHVAATSPGESAISFPSIGAVFTKAFCHTNISPSERLSLYAILKQLEENMNTIMTSGGATADHTQRPRVYCSREMSDPHFYEAQGLYSPPSPESSAGGDSDSNV